MCVLLVAMALPTMMFAQSQDPPWMDDLTWQLAVENDCNVEKVISTHESKVGGRLILNARLKCTDGRTLKAHRMEPQETFEIKLCEVVVC